MAAAWRSHSHIHGLVLADQTPQIYTLLAALSAHRRASPSRDLQAGPAGGQASSLPLAKFQTHARCEAIPSGAVSFQKGCNRGQECILGWVLIWIAKKQQCNRLPAVCIRFSLSQMPSRTHTNNSIVGYRNKQMAGHSWQPVRDSATQNMTSAFCPAKSPDQHAKKALSRGRNHSFSRPRSKTLKPRAPDWQCEENRAVVCVVSARPARKIHVWLPKYVPPRGNITPRGNASESACQSHARASKRQLELNGEARATKPPIWSELR